MNRFLSTARIALILSFVATPVAAQVVTMVTTDKNQYAYGEPIEIRVALSNATDAPLEFVTGMCPAHFSFDGLEYPADFGAVCVDGEQTVRLDPDSAHVWMWTLLPEEIGLPSTSGTHSIRGFFPSLPVEGVLADSTTIEAPRSLSGRIWVDMKDGVTQEELQPLMDSLNVEVLRDGPTSQLWQISGAVVDSVVARYQQDHRFESIAVDRFIVPEDFVTTSTERERRSTAISLGPAHPNPCRLRCSFKLRHQLPQHVRVTVHDVLGREVLQLYDGRLEAAHPHMLMIQASTLSSGLYIYRVVGDTYTISRKFVVARQ